MWILKLGSGMFRVRVVFRDRVNEGGCVGQVIYEEERKRCLSVVVDNELEGLVKETVLRASKKSELEKREG